MVSPVQEQLYLFIDADGVLREGRLVQNRVPPVRAQSWKGGDLTLGFPTSEKRAEPSPRAGAKGLVRMLSRSLSFSGRSSRVSDLRVGGSAGRAVKESSWRRFWSAPLKGLTRVPEEKELAVVVEAGTDRGQEPRKQVKQSWWRSSLYGREGREGRESLDEPHGPVGMSLPEMHGQPKFLFDSNGLPLFDEKKHQKQKKQLSKRWRRGFMTPPATDLGWSDHSSHGGGRQTHKGTASAPSTPHQYSRGKPEAESPAVRSASEDKEGKKAAGTRRIRHRRKSLSDGYISIDEVDRPWDEEEKGQWRAPLVLPLSPKADLQEAFFREYQKKASAAVAADIYSLPSPPAAPSEEFLATRRSEQRSPPLTPSRGLNAPFRLPRGDGEGTCVQDQKKILGRGRSLKVGQEGGGRQGMADAASMTRKGERVTVGGQKRRTHRKSLSFGGLSANELTSLLQAESRAPIAEAPFGLSGSLRALKLEIAVPDNMSDAWAAPLSLQSEHASGPIQSASGKGSSGRGGMASAPPGSRNSPPATSLSCGASSVSPRSPFVLQYSSPGESASSGMVSEDLPRMLLVPTEGSGPREGRREPQGLPLRGGGPEGNTLGPRQSGEPEILAIVHGMSGAGTEAAAATGISYGEGRLRRRAAKSRRGGRGEEEGLQGERQVGGVKRKEQQPLHVQKRKQLLQELKKWEWKEQGDNRGAEYEIHEKHR